MPGKHPAEAVENYLAPIRQSMSCFTKMVVRSNGCEKDRILTATLPEPTADLITCHKGEVLHLSFAQTFSIQQTLLGYKVLTRSYMYSLEDDDRDEILAFHWHPEATPENPIEFPHLHIGAGAAFELRPEFYGLHLATDRMSFEGFGILLLRSFGVHPDREDALDVLTRNDAVFRKHRSWP